MRINVYLLNKNIKLGFRQLTNHQPPTSAPTTATSSTLADISNESTSNSHTTADSSSTATSSTAPIINQIQQQIQQHELLTQCKILNKQLGLLRDNPSNNATSLPLENVTNLINAVVTVLPSTSNIRAAAASEASKKKRTSKDPTKPLSAR